jgi:Family of unknown function (DUF5320)
MPGFDGTGPRGMGPMTGGGRGFCNPWGVRGLRRGGISRSYPGLAGEQEMETLRSQAQAMSEQLEQIQKRLQALEGK